MTVATIASALKDEIAEATSDAQAKRLLRFAADGRRKKSAIHASAEAPMPRTRRPENKKNARLRTKPAVPLGARY